MATDTARNGLRAMPTITRPDVATQSMLQGLATLHPLVIAIDSERRVIWLSDDLDIVTDDHDGVRDLIGRPLEAFLRAIRSDNLDSSKPEALRFIDEMKKNGKVARARFDLCRESREGHAGGALSLEVSAFCMRDAMDNQLFVCVADRQEPRSSLELKNDELEACVRGVSHDLRSPLASLLGFTRLLREDYGEVLDPTGLHFVTRIDQAARHMEQLLHDMLELSRIGARIGATSQCRAHIHPTPILQQLHSELKLQLDEKNIELTLPEDPPTLLCDQTRLYQLFSNLIGNAINHMSMPRSSSGRVDVGIESVSDGWQITVADNGPGIAREDHQRIFGVFETAGRPDNHKRNSGLGLAIVKKIVETHSGRVWVESEPGDGARFIVWLPAS